MPFPSSRVRFWHELTAPEIRSVAGRSVTILPIAATEQHGLHLATGTDAMLNNLLQRGLVDSPPSQGELLILPTLTLGSSEHHVPFGGTLSVPPVLYTQLLVTLVRCLIEQGHTRIFILNSHGGNAAPMATALAEVGVECTRRGVLVGGASYWAICGAAWRKEIPDLALAEMGHACEIETSLMQVARPDLPSGPPPADVSYPDFLSEGWALALSFAALTREGSIGFPRHAGLEKGRKLFAIAVRELGRFLGDFSVRPPPQDLRLTSSP